VPRKTEPEPPPNPAFAPYRRAAAALYDGELLVGQLLARTNVWWTVRGPFWRRRYEDPVERVEWFVTFEAGVPEAHPDGWDDGVDADVSDLAAGQFRYRGKAWRVDWLPEYEAASALAAHGW
jgi:hypothetical protein